MARKIVITLIILIGCFTDTTFGFWVWTPESGKWENPKYKVKDTPEEQLSYAMDFYNANNYNNSLREFKKLIKFYPMSKEAPIAQYHIGRAMEALGSLYEAFKAYQKVIDTYPHTEFVDEIIDRQFDIGNQFFLGRKLKFGPIKFPAKDKAIEIFKAVNDNAPYGKYGDISIFNAGIAYHEIGDYENSIIMFKDIIDRYPDSKYKEEARYKMAESSKLLALKPDYDQTPTIVARKEFEDFIKSNPENSLSKDASDIVAKLKDKEAESLFNTAKFYESRRMLDSAIIYYNDIIKNYPFTKWSQLSQEKLNELEKKE